MVALPPKKRGLPDWAPEGAVNCRGMVRVNPRTHYLALVAIQGAFTDAILDTGGATSMVDVSMLGPLGLKCEKAEAGKSCGSFWGPSGEVRSYYGRVVGPVAWQFAGGLIVYTPELKVVDHGSPLVLVGTDILGR